MQKIEGLLGLCVRAGQITLGADLALREIRGSRAALALIDAGASDGTKKKISDACQYRRVPLYELPAGALDGACGRDGRMAAAVKDGPLARQLITLLSSAQADGNTNQTQNNANRGGASIS